MCIHFRNVRPQQAIGPHPTSEAPLVEAFHASDQHGVFDGKRLFKNMATVERFFSQFDEFLLAELAASVPPGEHHTARKEEL
ncbi:hypothetical protein JQX09_23620 [Sulfitobacter pseudonitzschiae]|uniref:Uncharacterized protein n=1 Tax=Pseudosulfitobacter pseudonitzschiae TaxID=1402135 RepID=A0A9Q2S2U1_9RHOB|nr:hypothetical protein [Pseudosulfitobacter pseudonitzschiae]MBU0643286.1 hypothetical protein [Alphaproteobacteria bacterium]MBM2294920.1 hypothetical protein [Pseudosulfitobacter pseudonitzschiae]MBM2299836.1 hypothetical protein [Pseudosulfitobacter pseudonitzschiae]MBM2304757.1 hypothetical protein [Pseudosulfitobacter pseudonitzschiae]MBM2314531.1 hypothetical protein [Pseudosulfitobacter pseudonitzschiae]